MSQTIVGFPDLDSSREEKDIAIRVIDERLNPTPVSHEIRKPLLKQGKPKKEVIEVIE